MDVLTHPGGGGRRTKGCTGVHSQPRSGNRDRDSVVPLTGLDETVEESFEGTSSPSILSDPDCPGGSSRRDWERHMSLPVRERVQVENYGTTDGKVTEYHREQTERVQKGQNRVTESVVGTLHLSKQG